MVVEERPPHMIVKRFGCTAIHNKSAIKMHHSFIHSFNLQNNYVENHYVYTLCNVEIENILIRLIQP